MPALREQKYLPWSTPKHQAYYVGRSHDARCLTGGFDVTNHRENVPRNAARVVCGNCETPYTFEEYRDVCISRSKWEQEVTTLESAVETAERVADKAVVDRDKARLEVISYNERKGKTGWRNYRDGSSKRLISDVVIRGS